jgi:hypothetical protein|tara:strand:- start:13 stop:363 length:351 start_codon:yes stop_codon:yes gene_type:complete
MDKSKKMMERLWAEMLADFFGNDMFFDAMEERLAQRTLPDERTKPLFKQFHSKERIVGEALTPVGASSFSIAPILYDETKINPAEDEEDKAHRKEMHKKMEEMSEEEINEHKEEKD